MTESFQMIRFWAPAFVISLLALALFFSGREVRAQTRGKYKRSAETYIVPDVTFVNQNGVGVKLGTLLSSKKVAMVDFIYTTCPTFVLCFQPFFSIFRIKSGRIPIMCNFFRFQSIRKMTLRRRLREYLKRYNAKPGWDCLTGPRDEIAKASKALDAYTPDKMSILP